MSTTYDGNNAGYALYASGSVVRTVCLTTSTALTATPYTVSGSTLTLGTAASVTTNLATFRTFLNGNGRIVCHSRNTTHLGVIFSLSGTTETASSVSLGTAPNSFNTDSDYVAVTASKTAFIATASSLIYANILTDTAGIASAGTEISNPILGVSEGIAGISANGNSTRFAISTSSTGGQIAQFTFDCSGASPVLSLTQTINNVNPSSGGASIATISSSNGYGVRYSGLLIANTRCNFVGGSSNSFNLSLQPSSITQPSALSSLYVGGGNFIRGAVGATNNDSFIVRSYNGNTVGYVIQRVEAAA
jgi:hypothetical protein